MVQNLHRDEFHRHGDINVTSPGNDISLRRIAGLKRNALMMSLSGAELNKLTDGGVFGHVKLFKNVIAPDRQQG